MRWACLTTKCTSIFFRIFVIMKKYNVGIIGYGWASEAHIEAINATSYAQVTAVWSSRKLDSAQLSGKHGSQITCYTDLDKMLANPNALPPPCLDSRAATASPLMPGLLTGYRMLCACVK